MQRFFALVCTLYLLLLPCSIFAVETTHAHLQRGMFVWVTNSPAQDPLASVVSQQSLLDFCGARGVTTIFLDMYAYLGNSNWTSQKVGRLRQFIEAAHKLGITVYALAGSADWALNQSWVQQNIIRNIKRFHEGEERSAKFDGCILDVEYWTDSHQQASMSCPALCDLMNTMRKTLGIPIGCFATFYLKDSNGTRPSFIYQGKRAQDGEFLMDNADFVVVGSYRNHAQDNTDGLGQISLLQPWYDYAKGIRKQYLLYCGSETINVTPSYVTYFGMPKAAMEEELMLISNHFAANISAIFLGQAIHNYDGWKAMS